MTNEASRRNEGALQCSGLLNLDTLHNFGWKVTMGGIRLHTCEQAKKGGQGIFGCIW